MVLFGRFVILSKKDIRSKVKNLLLYMQDEISGSEVDALTERFIEDQSGFFGGAKSC